MFTKGIVLLPDVIAAVELLKDALDGRRVSSNFDKSSSCSGAAPSTVVVTRRK